MKNSRFSLPLSLLTACVALRVAGLLAQAPATPAPAATPSVSAPASTAKTADADDEEKMAGGGMRERFMALTPEERQKVKAARKAAMKDPAVVAAQANRATDKRGFRKAMREAMVRSDASVAPILDKLASAAREKKAEKKGF